MRKSIHQFPFLSYTSVGLCLVARAPLIIVHQSYPYSPVIECDGVVLNSEIQYPHLNNILSEICYNLFSMLFKTGFIINQEQVFSFTLFWELQLPMKTVLP